MARAVWQRTIADGNGNVVPSATITVRDADTDDLAALFSVREGAGGLSNPFNADTDGFARFYVADGRYHITAEKSGSTSTWVNEVLESEAGGGGDGGGGTAACRVVFKPYDNEPPASDFATLDMRNSRPLLAFDATTQEGAVFSGCLDGYAGGGLAVTIFTTMSIAISGTIKFDAAFERTELSAGDIDSDSFATAQTETAITVPVTPGEVFAFTIYFNDSELDGLEDGDPFRLRIRRDPANDTAGGDAHVMMVRVLEIV